MSSMLRPARTGILQPDTRPGEAQYANPRKQRPGRWFGNYTGQLDAVQRQCVLCTVEHCELRFEPVAHPDFVEATAAESRIAHRVAVPGKLARFNYNTIF